LRFGGDGGFALRVVPDEEFARVVDRSMIIERGNEMMRMGNTLGKQDSVESRSVYSLGYP
jgi:hypothetical protein